MKKQTSVLLLRRSIILFGPSPWAYLFKNRCLLSHCIYDLPKLVQQGSIFNATRPLPYISDKQDPGGRSVLRFTAEFLKVSVIHTGTSRSQGIMRCSLFDLYSSLNLHFFILPGRLRPKAVPFLIGFALPFQSGLL
jgi:hypothetical protein